LYFFFASICLERASDLVLVQVIASVIIYC